MIIRILESNKFDPKRFTASVLIFGIVLVVFVCDFFLHLTFLRSPWSWGIKVLSPVEQRVSSLFHSPQLFVETVVRSRGQIEDLQARNAELHAQIGKSQFLENENAQLRQEIEKVSSSSSQPKKQVIARVISMTDSMTIDRGSQDGVNEKDLVFVSGVLIGQVTKAEQFFSQVSLFSQGKLSVVAQTQAGVKGVTRLDDKRFILDQIGADRIVSNSDTVFTTGSMEMNLPQGIYLGQILSLVQDPGMPTQQAVIDQGIDINSISLVEVVKAADIR